MASVYYGETDRTRGIFDYTLTEVSATTYLLTIRSRLQGKTYYYSGYRVSSKIAGSEVDSALGHLDSLKTDWYTFLDTGNHEKSYTRTTAAQSVVIGSSYTGEGDGEAYAGGKSGSTTVTVTIPAKPSYAVTYNANGGSNGPAAQTKWYGDALKLSTTQPTRTGYTFTGWNTAANGSGTPYTGGTNYTDNAALTLYAQWTINTYAVTYDGNTNTGGSTATQTKTYGTALTLRSNGFTKTGYNFVKWNTKSDGSGTSYNAGASYTANAAVKLYAIWTKKTYTVSYNANGGSGAPGNQTKTDGTALTLSSTKPTKTGSTFDYWVGSNGTNYNAGATVAANVNQNLTLTAHWTDITYTITFAANGGTGGPSSDTKTYGVAKTITTSIPTKEGYNFSGWSGSNGVTYAKGGTIAADVNQNLTLTAQWTKQTFTVSYSANGGTGAPGNQTKTYGTALTISSAAPTRTGYNFTGWLGSNGLTYQPGGTIAANVNQNLTLTAQWTLKTYTITYNANSGSGAPAAGSKNYGQEYTISSTRPTRTNYNFLGWATSSNATSATYQPGGKIAANVNQAVTLYAVWASAYWKPKIYYQTEGKIPLIQRLSSNETTANIAFNWAVYASGSITVAVGYRVSGTTGGYNSLWSVTRTAASGSENQNLSPSGGFSASSAYDIQISVNDGSNTSYYNGFLSSGFFIFRASKTNKGKSIAFGGAPETSGVPSNGLATFWDDVHFKGKLDGPTRVSNTGSASWDVGLTQSAIIKDVPLDASSGYYPLISFPTKEATGSNWSLGLLVQDSKLCFVHNHSGSTSGNTGNEKFVLPVGVTNDMFDILTTKPINLGGYAWGNSGDNAYLKFNATAGSSSFFPGIRFGANAGNWTVGTIGSEERLYFNYNDGTGTAATNTKRYYLANPGSGNTSYAILTSAAAVTIAQGGTGATTAAGALSNLGAAAASHTHSGADITSGTVSADRLPNASTTSKGIVTIGDQTFKGTKRFNYICQYARKNDGSAVRWAADLQGYNDAGSIVCERWYDTGDATNVTSGVWTWREYSPKSTADTETTGKYEDYALPPVNVGRTGNASYAILTSKDRADNKNVSAVFGIGANLVSQTDKDLNNYNANNGKIGVWVSYGSSDSASLTNPPWTYSGFKLFSIRGYSSTRGHQIALGAAVAPFIRYEQSNTAGDWSNWHRMVVAGSSGAGGSSTPVYISSNGVATAVTAVSIAKGGTGATTRLDALKALTNEAVTDPEYFLTITSQWAKGGYTTVAQAKTKLGIDSLYGSSHMGWKKVSMSFSNNSATVSATGVTTSSVIQAIRAGDGSTGTFYSVGAASCSTNGTIRVNAANGSTLSGSVNVHLWWSKTATGG